MKNSNCIFNNHFFMEEEGGDFSLIMNLVSMRNQALAKGGKPHEEFKI